LFRWLPNSEFQWRRALTVVFVAPMLLVAGGCQMQQSANGGPIPAPPAVSAVISFCNDGTPGCEPARSFSVASLRDLVITVAFQNVPTGNHVEQLEILLPGGASYRVTQGGFLIADATGSFSFSRNLAVAGSPVSLRHMTGEWSVRASLDGQVVATESVDLNP
jgi:hypothetical protein